MSARRNSWTEKTYRPRSRWFARIFAVLTWPLPRKSTTKRKARRMLPPAMLSISSSSFSLFWKFSASTSRKSMRLLESTVTPAGNDPSRPVSRNWCRAKSTRRWSMVSVRGGAMVNTRG